MSTYLEVERACVEAERAYFAALGRPPRIITTVREETRAERRCREAHEREYTPFTTPQTHPQSQKTGQDKGEKEQQEGAKR